GWRVEESDVVVVRADDPPHLRIGLLGRQIAPRLAIAVGLEGTVEELSGFVKARVVVSVNGGGDLEERADVIVRGDPQQLLPARARHRVSPARARPASASTATSPVPSATPSMGWPRTPPSEVRTSPSATTPSGGGPPG